jgi:hypothetical protein
LNTYLSHVVGFLLTKLPVGGLMLGMNFCTSLIVSVTALLGYRFFVTKMPAWAAFAGQLIAISWCWCPTVILYNYLTYFLFLLGAIFLFRGLVGSNRLWLVWAGVCLGANIFARTPNILEAALIVCVWYYAWLRRKKRAEAWRETLLCLAGYAGAVAVMSAVMMLHYGSRAPLEMIASLWQMSDSNSQYTFAGMLWMIGDAYLVGAKWLLIIMLCVLVAVPFFQVRLDNLLGGKVAEEKIALAQKILYCLAIIFLFYALSRIGMYNFEYFQKFSNLQWAVIFLLLSLANMVWMLCSASVDVHWKLLASIGIVISLVTPLGSNNYVWPLVNNLFFIAPITVWHIYKLVCYAPPVVGTERFRLPLFPLKAMLAAMLMAVFVQSLGVGIFYVYRDGEDGTARNAKVTGNEVLRGMRTTADNAVSLQEITVFAQQYAADTELILFGNIPGLSYYLQRPPALTSAWPDLDTFAMERWVNELDDLSGHIEIKGRTKPLVIVNTELPEFKTVQAKREYLAIFMAKHGYTEVFRNAQFIVYA